MVSSTMQHRPGMGAFPRLLFIAALFFCGGFLVACGSSTGSSGETSPSGASSSATSSEESSSSSSSSSSEPDCSLDETAAEQSGFSVSEGALVDVNDNGFVMRGVNYPYAWYRDQEDTGQQFADIANTGANAVRVVLANGEQWERVSGDELANIIDWAKANHLVAVLEIHDSTGWAESDNAADPQTAVDYWLSCDIRQALQGEQAHVIINIANEPLGNDKTDDWVSFHSGAIEQLRAAGLPHTLIVDAPNWGQDWTNTMRDGNSAQTVFNADQDANVVFSVHMYDVYDTDSAVEDYFQAFADKNLPLIVGEFAADHGVDDDGSVNEVAEEAILSGAEAHGFGYLGWSWSGNTTDGGLDSLDIVEDFNLDTPSEWGETLINHIDATAEVCSCFVEQE